MAKTVNLIGNKYGKLLVIARGEDYISPNGIRLKRWRCKCDCGNEINVATSQLKRGQKSCGCVSLREDLTGRKYNMLKVLHQVDDYISPKGVHMSRWHCKCECGNEIDVLGMSLKNGSTKSCGCISHYDHNKSHSLVTPDSLIGKKYGYMKIEECLKYEGTISKAKFLCKCECGNEKVLTYNALNKNKNISCGCKNNVHVPKKHTNKSIEIGKTYGQLKIIEELDPHITPNGSKQRIVKCLCSCGNEFTIRLVSAKQNGKCRDCLNKDKRVDITGKRFGKLVVISMADDYISPTGTRLAQCRCQCDCGKITIVSMSSLVTGTTRSCGCLLNSRGMLKDDKELMKRYDFERNRDIDLDSLTARCNKKVWWKCEKCGESWEAQVASQNDKNKKHGCPYCSGRLVVKGKNDLLSQHPEIINEWDFGKNKISPDEIHQKSGTKVWWICSTCGHRWKATVGNRAYNKSGCPKCNKENVNSFCEQAVFYYVKQAFPDTVNTDMHLGVELDIYIPSINVAIEYDGEAWHKSPKRIINDAKKNSLCKAAGIKMIRIREPKLEAIDNCTVIMREDSTTDKSLNIAILELLKVLKCNGVSVDVERDTTEILSQYISKKRDNSLATCFPEIAEEFHPNKNGNLTADMISKSSRHTVWWLGKCGHEWQAPVGQRTRPEHMTKSGRLLKGSGCPYCGGKKVLEGYNDLLSNFPEIALDWHPSKNGNLNPQAVSCKSSMKVWWLGKCGHEWQDTINHRTGSNRQCPFCYRKRRSPSVECIETGKTYDTAREAAEDVGLKSGSTIYACCRGDAKTAGGYHWKYNEMT